MNELINIAYQIQNDIDNVKHHKYMAHQITVLYRYLSNVSFGKPFKKTIEAKFDDIKASLKPAVGVPCLNAEYRHFLRDITTNVILSAENSGEGIMEKLGKANLIIEKASGNLTPRAEKVSLTKIKQNRLDELRNSAAAHVPQVSEIMSVGPFFFLNTILTNYPTLIHFQWFY